MLQKMFVGPRDVVRIYQSSFTGIPSKAWWLAGVIFVNRTGTMVIPFLSLYLMEQRGFSTAQAGLILTLYGLGAVGGTLCGGWLTDRLGPTRIQACSLFGAAVSIIGLWWAQTPTTIALMSFCFGTIAESMRPANQVASILACPPELRTRGFTLLRLAVNLGMTFGPMLGGLLATLGYQWLFTLDAATCVAAGILLVWRFGWKDDHLPIPLSGAPSNGVRSPWHDKFYVACLLLNLALATVFFQLFGTFFIYMKNIYGMNEAQLGSLIALNCFIVVLVEMPLVKHLEHTPPLRWVALGGFLLALACLVLPLGTSAAFAILAILLFTAAEIFWMPMLGGFATRRADERIRGKYLGAYSSIFSWGHVLAPLLGTYLYQHVGPSSVWWCGVAVASAASVGFMVLSSRLTR